MTDRALSSRSRRRRAPAAALGAVTLLGAVALGLAVGTAGGTDPVEQRPTTSPTGPMGGHVVNAQGAATGAAVAAGVTVEGAVWHLGRVPLMVTVEPTWTLVNTADQAVALGQPHAEVIEGCCPGPLAVDSTQLAPGASATLRFPLQMHPGMEGPHDFAVHVPVTSASGDQSVLTLGVKGDFSGG